MAKIDFKLSSNFSPTGDQPQAISELCRSINGKKKDQVLLGVTGSGKTFSIANVIARLNRPALIIAPNKTLAAQLYSEFKGLFPDNAVEYFVSYYDYYQPEAYLPNTDTFIEKDASINDEIDKLRHSTTRSLMERQDVLVVASVSCIYGLGSPQYYRDMLVFFEKQKQLGRDQLIRQLIDIQYSRNDYDFYRGTFRVRGEVVEIFPPYEADLAFRVEFLIDNIEEISAFDPLTGELKNRVNKLTLFPASHYVSSEEIMKKAIVEIKEELQQRLAILRSEQRLVEAKRLEQRTLFDIETMEESGFCPGIENYSRFLDRRQPGEAPYTLLDYFPQDYLLIIDESHVTVPQIGGMFKGDRSRKETLVEHGFRLPSAKDNRPLTFDEFSQKIGQTIYVSATPADYELQRSGGEIVEQLIRPTGLLDPALEIKPATNQVEDLLIEIKKRIALKQRVLVTTLTKRMSEDLTSYYQEQGIKAEYLHSDIKTVERQKLLNDLRRGIFDVLIGINLLREGLDLPEVSLVAILDADKEGFLRSARSLIQTCGRAARNVEGTVIFYADKRTKAIAQAAEETARRRQIQDKYNKENNIAPQTISKAIDDPIARLAEADYLKFSDVDNALTKMTISQIRKKIKQTKKKMLEAAAKMEFEEAATFRDRLREFEKYLLANS